jgi:hypothetical protein
MEFVATRRFVIRTTIDVVRVVEGGVVREDAVVVDRVDPTSCTLSRVILLIVRTLCEIDYCSYSFFCLLLLWLLLLLFCCFIVALRS